jgi:hypothetical protein
LKKIGTQPDKNFELQKCKNKRHNQLRWRTDLLPENKYKQSGYQNSPTKEFQVPENFLFQGFLVSRMQHHFCFSGLNLLKNY